MQGIEKDFILYILATKQRIKNDKLQISNFFKTNNPINYKKIIEH